MLNRFLSISKYYQSSSKIGRYAVTKCYHEIYCSYLVVLNLKKNNSARHLKFSMDFYGWFGFL